MRGQLKQAGFTLAEVLIIAPVVILVIGSFIVFIVNITGETLKTKASIEALGERQTALNFIQNDIRLSSGFVDTITAPTTPQGSDNATADWTNSGATTADESLILTRYATDINPIDQDSVFIYRDTPNSCASNENQLYTYYSVYFLDTTTKTLWQRNVMPDYPTILADLCADPWQLPSCAESVIAANPTICKTEDIEVAKNVEGFDIRYLDGSGTETSNRSDTESIEIVIETSKAVAGQTLTSSSTLRTSKRDNAGDPTNQYNIGWTFPSSAPTTPSFYWSAVSGADNYDVRYRVNGGAWSGINNVAGGATTHSYNGAEVFRDDTVTIEVTAKQGSTPITTVSEATATIPKWTECEMQNGWTDYHPAWSGAEFTKTSAGVVMMRGMIKAGTTTSGTVICTLPSGFRPDNGTLIFFTATAGTTAGRLDVETDGDILYRVGHASWESLSAITFATDSSGWQTPTASNGWVNYDGAGGYSDVRYKPDALGRVQLQGLARSGSYTGYSTVAYTLPGGYVPSAYDIHPSYPCASTGSFTFRTDAAIVPRNLPGNSCWSLQAVLYPSSYTGDGGWQYPTPPAGWSNYGSGYASAGYIKSSDGVVSLRGLIVNASNGETLFTLPTGYRPSKTVLCYVVTNPETFARVDVGADGTVISREGTNASWLSLAGCNFMAEQ